MKQSSDLLVPDSHRFSGIGTALVTPFNADGSIDHPALASLVESQIAHGVDYLVVLGSTAETPTLFPDEREAVKRTVVSTCRKRVPLVLGMGGNCTAALAEEIRHADLDGFDAILSVCPYYNKPSQKGLIQHFTAVANASPLPVIVYNVPGRTGINMLPETVIELAKSCANIIGIKEASGSKEQIHRLAELVRRDAELIRRSFAVISGDDGLTPELMAQGDVCGVISVLSNAYPAEWKQCVTSNGGNFSIMIDLLFREGNPAGIKALLSVKGLCGNVLRLPLTAVSDNLRAELKAADNKLG